MDFRHRNLEHARKHPVLTSAQATLMPTALPANRAGNVAALLNGIIAEMGAGRESVARKLQEGRGAGRVLLAELLLDGVTTYTVFTNEELAPYRARLHWDEYLPAPALTCVLLCELIRRVHTELWRRVAARNQEPTSKS